MLGIVAYLIAKCNFDFIHMLCVLAMNFRLNEGNEIH